MPLSESRAGVIRTLFETAPDKVLRSLEQAMGGQGGGALSAVRVLLDHEIRDRAVRDAVFAPILPLFWPRPDGLDQLLFPAAALTKLWRVLKTTRPAETQEAAAAPARGSPGDGEAPVYDRLCHLAARGLRGGEAYAGVRQVLDDARPGADAELIACLDLTPIARTALDQLPDWLARMTDERAATARLMFKDAVAIAEDAGPWLLEILIAHLGEPWTILRVISAVMLKPGDRYASGSELAGFGERLLRDIDRRVAAVKAFDYDQGPHGGLAAAEALKVAGAIAAEFEHSFTLDRAGPWGERLARQKQALAGLAEGHLRKVDRAVAEALPLQPVRMPARGVRPEPRLETGPDEGAVRRARALLIFLSKVRGAAAQGGYGAARAKVAEDVSHRLDAYVEDLLATLHAGETAHLDHAHAYLEIVAQFAGLAHDEQAAQIVRRRAAAA